MRLRDRHDYTRFHLLPGQGTHRTFPLSDYSRQTGVLHAVRTPSQPALHRADLGVRNRARFGTGPGGRLLPGYLRYRPGLLRVGAGVNRQPLHRRDGNADADQHRGHGEQPFRRPCRRACSKRQGAAPDRRRTVGFSRVQRDKPQRVYRRHDLLTGSISAFASTPTTPPAATG